MNLYTYAGSANGYKVELALAQLGRRYARRELDIFAGEARTEAFLARSPAGRVPVLELDDGTWISESNAILWEIGRGTPLGPTNAREETQIVRWLCFEQNSIEPVIGSARFWRLTGRDRGREDETQRRIDAARRALEIVDRELVGQWLVADRYTIADIAVYAYAHLADDVGIALAAFPRVAAWCERVEAQPGYIAGPAPYSASARVG